MKLILSLSILIFLISSCQPKELPTVSEIKKDFAEVKFSHMTTKDEMIGIRDRLKSVTNIDLVFDQSEFLENGRLQILKIGVIMPNGTKGSASADLMKLQFNYYGFLYNPKGKPSATIGVM